MKGLIFMVIVTLVVLASFARPDKETGSPTTSPQVSTASHHALVKDSSQLIHKKRY